MGHVRGRRCILETRLDVRGLHKVPHGINPRRDHWASCRGIWVPVMTLGEQFLPYVK